MRTNRGSTVYQNPDQNHFGRWVFLLVSTVKMLTKLKDEDEEDEEEEDFDDLGK